MSVWYNCYQSVNLGMYIDIFEVFSFAEHWYLWTLTWTSYKETHGALMDKNMNQFVLWHSNPSTLREVSCWLFCVRWDIRIVFDRPRKLQKCRKLCPCISLCFNQDFPKRGLFCIYEAIVTVSLSSPQKEIDKLYCSWMITVLLSFSGRSPF
jgi:hypothetical protein